MSKHFDYSPLPYPMYLTGVSTEQSRNEQRADLGLLCTPASSVHLQRHHYSWWAADNGCFAEYTGGKPFDEQRWLDWLAPLAAEPTLLWAVLPDVVGDARATHERSMRYLDRVRELGAPVAWVAQDGLEAEPVLLDEIVDVADCLFIGGSTDWKLDEHVQRPIVDRALDAGLWVHVGRVNSRKRLRFAASIGAHSADGTYLKYGNREQRPLNYRKLMTWLDELRAEYSTQWGLAA